MKVKVHTHINSRFKLAICIYMNPQDDWSEEGLLT